MAKEKKGAKIGRNLRAPSNRLQPIRTQRNKIKHVKRAAKDAGISPLAWYERSIAAAARMTGAKPVGDLASKL